MMLCLFGPQKKVCLHPSLMGDVERYFLLHFFFFCLNIKSCYDKDGLCVYIYIYII